MATEKKKNVFDKIVNWVKEVRGELRKVVYPTFKHTRKNTIVVLTVVVIVALLIAGLDWVFYTGRSLVIQNDPISQIQGGDVDMGDVDLGDGSVQVTDENGNVINTIPNDPSTVQITDEEGNIIQTPPEELGDEPPVEDGGGNE